MSDRDLWLIEHFEFLAGNRPMQTLFQFQTCFSLEV